MMVDVMTIQSTDAKTSLLQNRQFYPFQGIQDDTNNFYAGKEYTFQTNLSKKRPLSTTTTIETELLVAKRQKQQATTVLKTNYTFTSKPYDVMENLMYYY